MADFESPTCALDLRHRSNCLGIASAKSGQEIRVLVRPEDDATAKLLKPWVPSAITGSRSRSW